MAVEVIDQLQIKNNPDLPVVAAARVEEGNDRYFATEEEKAALPVAVALSKPLYVLGYGPLTGYASADAALAAASVDDILILNGLDLRPATTASSDIGVIQGRGLTLTVEEGITVTLPETTLYDTALARVTTTGGWVLGNGTCNGGRLNGTFEIQATTLRVLTDCKVSGAEFTGTGTLRLVGSTDMDQSQIDAFKGGGGTVIDVRPTRSPVRANGSGLETYDTTGDADFENAAPGEKSAVIGGNGNEATGKKCFIGAGTNNSVAGDYGAIIGSQTCTVTGEGSSVVNCQTTTVDAPGSVAIGCTGTTIPDTCSGIVCISCRDFTVPASSNTTYIGNVEVV